MARSVQQLMPGYAPGAVGSGFASVASDFELALGRPLLLAKIRELLDLPGGVEPTAAHRGAVLLFPRIITTNYDGLFESAATSSGSGHSVIAGPKLPNTPPEKFVWKIQRSLDRPEVLAVTEADVAHFESFRPEIVEELRAILSTGPLLVGQTSLRDPSFLRLFREIRGSFEGYWSVPPGDPLTVRRALELG